MPSICRFRFQTPAHVSEKYGIPNGPLPYNSLNSLNIKNPYRFRAVNGFWRIRGGEKKKWAGFGLSSTTKVNSDLPRTAPNLGFSPRHSATENLFFGSNGGGGGIRTRAGI